ncbi:uncharacterized protein At4g06744-like [Benincasa hispida]|uniref:uncharacterized protein At4g06744-like n=1 Tax=Benincasa hispida TaxID=102211 RepID=UPI00190043F0|nr:uncharacterized protein At4g06744-like [Benincasa hispida]
MWLKLFTVFLVLQSSFLLHGVVAQTGPPRPNPTITRIRPRPSLIPPGVKLMPRRPNNNPGPLANRARILYITQELKRNITYDPKGYTKTWVGNNYCLFKGFFCDVVPDLNITGLSSIDFSGARFGGPFLNFYRFIRNLPDIALFHANSNNFTGVINRNINKLRFLYELDLSNNKFLGGFPGYVLGANKLSFVDFRFNTYNGSVPYRLFNIDTDVLFINNNGFGGRIPQATFGNTPALYITLANNKFTGPIPPTIGRAWRTLREVLFLKNKLSGCLPFEIGYLVKATVFDANTNILTGPIPQSFGCLFSLQILNLANNQFYGPIPESLCRLPDIYNITLSNNYFTRIGPQCRKLVTAQRLHVQGNCIPGFRLQKTQAQCATFFAKPRSCPRANTFNYVPCTLPTAAQLNAAAVTSVENMVPPSPRSYAALERPHPHH